MGLRGTPDPAMAGTHVPDEGVPFMFIFCLSHMRGAAVCPPPPSLPSPTAIGKGSPHRPWVLRSHGQGCP